MEKRTRNNRPVHVTKYCTAPEKFSTETARHNSAIRTLKYFYTVLAKIDADIEELKTLCNETTVKNMLHDLEGQRLEEFKKIMADIEQLKQIRAGAPEEDPRPMD